MNNTAAVLAAMSNMQSNIQTANPVIPNNGNPAGAYNMPQGQAATQQPSPNMDRYAWIQPSPYMAYLQSSLQDRGARIQAEMEQMYSQPVLPVAQPEPVMRQPQQAPVIPQQNYTVQDALQRMVTRQQATPQTTGAPVIPQPQAPVQAGAPMGNYSSKPVLPMRTGVAVQTRAM